MASKNIPFSKIRRNSKNASNWVALGAKMKIWKLWSHDWCPKCNKQEDDWTHIICCSSQEGRVRWEQSIRKLEAQLSEIKTDPWITKFVPEMLSKWCKSTNLSNLLPRKIAHLAFASQNSIGWENMLAGQIGPEWRKIQSSYIKTHNTKIDIEQWTRSFVRLL